jgi:uracil-DNA glycosylase family 4
VTDRTPPKALLHLLVQDWVELGGPDLRLPPALALEPAPERHESVGGAEPTPPAGDSSPWRSLAEVAAAVAQCRQCPLCETRKQTVPGEGNPRPRILFVGEGPGADEDRSGRPFVGAAGQLLTRIIEGGMGLRRDEVFIANVVKCRPPGNRQPEPLETAACGPFLDRQIELLQPEVIVALGRTATCHLLQTDRGITALRGKWASWRGIPVMPTWHPSALLHDPTKKRDTWDDVKLVLGRLGLQVPGRSAANPEEDPGGP